MGAALQAVVEQEILMQLHLSIPQLYARHLLHAVLEMVVVLEVVLQRMVVEFVQELVPMIARLQQTSNHFLNPQHACMALAPICAVKHLAAVVANTVLPLAVQLYSFQL